MDLSSIVNSCEQLKHAQSYSFKELPNEIAAIKLEFETFSCFIHISEGSDEISLDSSIEFGDLLASEHPLLFQNCFGLKLCWGWSMVNNQGYSDSLKFEFENNKIVELVVLSSSIIQYVVREL